MSQEQAAAPAFDPSDPHGFHAEDHGHGHVIVPWQILLGTLVTLLVLTLVTVFVAQAEIFVTGEWGWQLPGWLNIIVAMGIALVKGSLVALYFMQLRYDKGVNAVIMLFTLFAVTLFLMFTMIDLGGRHHVTEWRAGEINPGATNVIDGVVANARANYIAENGLTEEEFWEQWDAHHSGHGHHGPEHSTADHSVPAEGLTPGLFTGSVWADLEHHDEEHHGDDHADGH